MTKQKPGPMLPLEEDLGLVPKSSLPETHPEHTGAAANKAHVLRLLFKPDWPCRSAFLLPAKTNT